MSGFIDFGTETAVADWPLESETDADGQDGFFHTETIALGLADTGVVEKDS